MADFGAYEDFTDDELKTIRKRILEQRAKGLASFSYGGQTFTYSSPAQMKLVADEIQREIGRRVAKASGRIPASQVSSLPIFSRPLSE